MLRFLKEWTLPVAIVFGSACYLLFSHLPALDAFSAGASRFFDIFFPFCVFLTLFTTFAKVDFHAMRPCRWHFWLIVAQLLIVAANVGIVLWVEDNPTQKLIWESMLTCAIGPCASAAPVVTAKLGGNVSSMTTYTLISSLLCAVTIPLVFPLLEKEADVTFLSASLAILQKLCVVLLLPLLLGWFVRHRVPRVHRFIVAHPNLGFYFWGVSLAITTGITVKNISHSQASPLLLLGIALVSFAICWVHFGLGRFIGGIFQERINAGQGMFQKNTAMAIWVAYMYLNPIASIGAGCYVLWQNIINSYEIWEHGRQKKQASLAR